MRCLNSVISSYEEKIKYSKLIIAAGAIVDSYSKEKLDLLLAKKDEQTKSSDDKDGKSEETTPANNKVIFAERYPRGDFGIG